MKILRTPASGSKVTAWDHRQVGELDRHGNDILEAPPGSLVFLKGRTHPTHYAGVLHRSPPLVVGEKRLIAVLDF